MFDAIMYIYTYIYFEDKWHYCKHAPLWPLYLYLTIEIRSFTQHVFLTIASRFSSFLLASRPSLWYRGCWRHRVRRWYSEVCVVLYARHHYTAGESYPFGSRGPKKGGGGGRSWSLKRGERFETGEGNSGAISRGQAGIFRFESHPQWGAVWTLGVLIARKRSRAQESRKMEHSKIISLNESVPLNRMSCFYKKIESKKNNG